LKLYTVKKWVDLILYKLKLPLLIKRLYSVFYVMKLTTTSENPIPGWYILSPLDSVIVNGKKIESEENPR